MSRKEMISYLGKNGVKASTKDNTVRLSRKVEKVQAQRRSSVLDRKVRKLVKRIQRAIRKKGRESIPRWMDRALSSGDMVSFLARRVVV